MAKISGKWGEKNMIRLMEGSYDVTGYARPSSYNQTGIDTLSLSFEETITIVPNTTALTLNAQYDSYLLMFDASTIEKIQYYYNNESNVIHGNKIHLPKGDDICYMFVKDFYGAKINTVQITRKNSKFTEVDLKNIPLEKGKWYYFNDLTESFDLPKMESGN